MAELEITRSGLEVPVRVDPTRRDGPSPQQARGGKWRRTAPGLYVPAGTDSAALDQRIVEVAAGLPDGAAVTGWAALAWIGGRWFDGHAADGTTPLQVPVAVDDRRRIRPRPGARLSEDWLFPDDVVRVDGLPVTVPNRSVTWEARRARNVVAALQTIDMAAYDDLVDLEDLAAYVARLPARPGVRRLRRAVDLGDENAWSPQEPPMRFVWTHEARLSRPLCNPPIFDADGRHVLTPDLFDPEVGVAGEYDGDVHGEADVRRRDLDREERYRAHGIEVVTMMSTDRRDTSAFSRRLRAAYHRASTHPVSGTWTIEQPDWWVDTSTVAQRRALAPADRERWLAWRREDRRT